MAQYDFHIPPPPRFNPPSERRQILEEMPVGASFLFENCSLGMMSVLTSKLFRKKGMKFTSRTVIVGGKRHLRVWKLSQPQAAEATPAEETASCD